MFANASVEWIDQKRQRFEKMASSFTWTRNVSYPKEEEEKPVVDQPIPSPPHHKRPREDPTEDRKKEERSLKKREKKRKRKQLLKELQEAHEMSTIVVSWRVLVKKIMMGNPSVLMEGEMAEGEDWTLVTTW